MQRRLSMLYYRLVISRIALIGNRGMEQIVGSLYNRAMALPPRVLDHHHGLGAWSCDLETEALEWTDGVFDIFGLDRGCRLDRREIVALYDEPSRELLERTRSAAIAARRPFSFEARIWRADGTARWMRVTGTPRVVGGRVVSLSGMKQDVTGEREAWEALRRLALRDPLTGLSNRACFQSEFLDLPAGSDALAEIGALVLLDMDRFKAINDNWGHLAGDACLTVLGRRLMDAFPDAWMAARLGGDEFALLLKREDQPIALSQRVRAAIERIEAPLPWNGNLLPLRVSAGVALTSPFEPTDAGALFAKADARLYRDKAARAQAVTG